MFPNRTNLTDVNFMLPDLRGYLVTFDYKLAIAGSSTANDSESNSETVLGAFETGTYRQYCWAGSALFVAAAVIIFFVFMFQIVWAVCCVSCGCRKRDPTKKQKIYAKYQKIIWGTLMILSFGAAATAAAYALFTVFSDVKPVCDSIINTVNVTLADDLASFESSLLTPLDELISVGYRGSNGYISLQQLQTAAIDDLVAHTFLENQSYALDVVRKPVFDVVGMLHNYSLLFPTVIDNHTDCIAMNITPSTVSRMTVGGATGCFRCKTCSLIDEVIEDAADYWRRNPFAVQMDLLTSKRQLHSFGESNTTLTAAIKAFTTRIHASCTSGRADIHRTAHQLHQLITEAKQLTVFGLFVLADLGLISLVLSIVAIAHGIATNKRHVARSTCYIAEVTTLLAIVMTGVLYAAVWMAHDGIVALQLLDDNVSTFAASSLAAIDMQSILFDENLVASAGMNATLAFSDTLRVPPLPTPTDDDPSRFNMSKLYTLSSLVNLEDQMADSDAALVDLFGWSEQFARNHHEYLLMLAFGNSTVVSPYNQTIHQVLLNSTTERLVDPDNDANNATSSDLSYIEAVFNDSWRGVADAGVRQNNEIAAQWLFIAQLYVQKQSLVRYIATVYGIAATTHPLLGTQAINHLFAGGVDSDCSVSADNLIALTAAMEDAEFQLKAPVEFATDTIRHSKINDCSFNGNCRTSSRVFVSTIVGMLLTQTHSVI